VSSVLSRTFSSVPERPAAATWDAIVAILAPDSNSEARGELNKVANEAATLIAEKSMLTAPIIVTGSGPRVRVYCAYDEDAVDGSKAKEDALSFDATGGDWALSLPCPSDDLGWVTSSLASKSSRVTARDLSLGIKLSQSDSGEDGASGSEKAAAVTVDWGAFVNQ